MTHTEQMAGADPASATQFMNERWQRLFRHLDAIDATEHDIIDTADMYQAYCHDHPEINTHTATNLQSHLGRYAVIS